MLADAISEKVKHDVSVGSLDMKENQFLYDSIIYSTMANQAIKDFVNKNKDKQNLAEVFKKDANCQKALSNILEEAKEKGDLHHQVFYHKDSRMKPKSKGQSR